MFDALGDFIKVLLIGFGIVSVLFGLSLIYIGVTQT